MYSSQYQAGILTQQTQLFSVFTHTHAHTCVCMNAHMHVHMCTYTAHTHTSCQWEWAAISNHCGGLSEVYFPLNWLMKWMHCLEVDSACYSTLCFPFHNEHRFTLQIVLEKHESDFSLWKRQVLKIQTPWYWLTRWWGSRVWVTPLILKGMRYARDAKLKSHMPNITPIARAQYSAHTKKFPSIL